MYCASRFGSRPSGKLCAVNAANAIGNLKDSTPLRDFFQRISFKKGRVSAISATARKLAVIVWNMVTKGTRYINPEGYLFLDQKRKLGLVKRIQKQIDKLLSGVVLDDDPKPVKASSCQILAPNLLELVLTEGKYHQVKRMVAAVSNRVEGLHRAKIGGLELPADLAPGQWRWLSQADLTLLMQK